MAESLKTSPVARWMASNAGKPGFAESLQKLLGFACADWIRRESGAVLTPENALSKVVAAAIPEYPLGSWLESVDEKTAEIADFCEKIKILPLPESLQGEFPSLLDLRGVKCPRNAACSRLVMAGAPQGHRMEIYLDEGSPIENVPQSLVADGHFVEKREKKGSFWSIIVVKG